MIASENQSNPCKPVGIQGQKKDSNFLRRLKRLESDLETTAEWLLLYSNCYGWPSSTLLSRLLIQGPGGSPQFGPTVNYRPIPFIVERHAKILARLPEHYEQIIFVRYFWIPRVDADGKLTKKTKHIMSEMLEISRPKFDSELTAAHCWILGALSGNGG